MKIESIGRWILRVVPIHRVSIRSMLPPDEVARRLRDRIEPKRLLSRPEAPFRGAVRGYSFCLAPSNQDRNLFRPYALGRIKERSGGSLVVMTVRPHAPTLILLLLNVTLAVGAWVVGGTHSRTDMAMPLVLLAVTALIVASFWLVEPLLRAQIADAIEGSTEDPSSGNPP